MTTGRPGPAGSPTSSVAALQQRLRDVPGDHRGWATLSLAYVEQARVTADPTFYAKADAAARPRRAARTRRLGGAHRAGHARRGAPPVPPRARGRRRGPSTSTPTARRPGRCAPTRSPSSAATRAARAAARARRRPRARPADLRPALLPGRAARRPRRGDPADAALPRRGDRRRAGLRLRVLPPRRAGPHRRRPARRPGGTTPPRSRPTRPTLRPSPAGPGSPPPAATTPRPCATYRSVVARLPLPEYVAELADLYLATGRPDQAEQQLAVAAASARLAAANGVRTDLETALVEADHGSPADALRAARAEWSVRRTIHTADAMAWALHAAGRDRAALALRPAGDRARHAGRPAALPPRRRRGGARAGPAGPGAPARRAAARLGRRPAARAAGPRTCSRGCR